MVAVFARGPRAGGRLGIARESSSNAMEVRERRPTQDGQDWLWLRLDYRGPRYRALHDARRRRRKSKVECRVTANGLENAWRTNLPTPKSLTASL